MNPKCAAPFVALLLTTLAGAMPVELWVSPRGDDARGRGTRAAPWRTIPRARDEIRNSRLNAAAVDGVLVNLAGGEYPIVAPIFFSAADSGRPGHVIVYRSADGPGAASIVGGMRITGWIRDDAHVWKAALAPAWSFHTLYENGRRAWIAREPNYAPDSKYPGYFGEYLFSAGGGEASIVYPAGALDPASWRPNQHGEIWWWGHEGKRNWGMCACPITGIDLATRTIRFPAQESPATADERFFVQGFRELLDAPGEFYLDSAGATLYYWPRDGDPNLQEIYAPRVSEIFQIEGDGVGRPVHDLKFSGLAVRCTDFVADSVKIVGPPRAAFFLRHASRIELRDCHLFNLGNLAVRVLEDGSEDTIAGCWIERTGEGGIQIWNGLARAEFPTARSERHRVLDCRIEDFNQVRTTTHWCGVQLFDTNDCEVANCEISDSGRYALSLRGNYSTEEKNGPDTGGQPARGNWFHHLRLRHGGGDSGDMGLLHAAHVNPPGGPNLNTWEQIDISEVRAHPSMDDVPPDGIFLDHAQSCENQILRNIRVSDVEGKPFRTNKNPDQSLLNVSWQAGFDIAAMDESQIGLTADFPAPYRRK